jgi:hypothetical protein
MWAAVLVFCLFLLLVSFFLYGFHHWENLLADPEDESAPNPLDSSPHRQIPQEHPSGRILAFWVLVIGLGIIALLEEFLLWIGAK